MVNPREFLKVYIASIVEWAREQAKLRQPPAYLPAVLIILMIAILVVDVGLAAEAFNSLYSNEYAEKTTMDWVLTFAKALLPIAPAVILKTVAAQFGIFSADKITWSNRDRTWIKRAKIVWGIALAIFSAVALLFLYKFGQTAMGQISANVEADLAAQQSLDLFASSTTSSTQSADSYDWLALSLPLSAVGLALCWFRLELYHVEVGLFRHYDQIHDLGEELLSVELNIAHLNSIIVSDEDFNDELEQAALTGEQQVIASFVEGLSYPTEQILQNDVLVSETVPVKFDGKAFVKEPFAFRNLDEAKAQLNTCFDVVDQYNK